MKEYSQRQFEPDLGEDEDDYEIKPSAFQKFLSILTCRSVDQHQTFSGAEDSIRVGLKKGIAKASEQKKARTGSMYVPRATIPLVNIEDPDAEEGNGKGTQ